MLANHDVDVVGHDGAGVTGVALPLDNGAKGSGDLLALVRCEANHRKLQSRLGFLVELPHRTPGGLQFLAAEVRFT